MKAFTWLTYLLTWSAFAPAPVLGDVKDVNPFDEKYATPPTTGNESVFAIPALDSSLNDNSVPVEQAESQFELLSSIAEFKPGEPFYLSLKITHPQGWYSYYKNPGAVGQTITINWDLPDGWTAGELIYPVPKISESRGAVSYKNSGTNHFITKITPPSSAQPGDSATLKAFAKWQICDPQNCVQEPSIFHEHSQSGFPLEVTVSAATQTSTPSAEITSALAASAQPSSAWDLGVRILGQNIELVLTPKDGAISELKDVYFFASEPNLTNSAGKQTLTRTEKGYTLSIPKLTGENAVKDFDYATLGGILKAKSGWESGADFKALAVDSVSIVAAERYQTISIGKFFGIAGAMLIGGLLLNLMPCVFPVIGLKIMGFVSQAGEDKKKIVLHGIAFVVGVLVSFWVISGILLFLRETALNTGGESTGWGFQLQNPWVVWILMLVMLILGLSMFGLFEIGAKATSVGADLQNKSGLSGTFFSGVLATVVATPCSAPFLGTAIGVAMKLPPVQFMLAFTAMALGLGLPYLILSIFPNLVKKLPRPGPWMESFKQGMSFLLFGTAGFLLWVYMSLNDGFHGLSIVLGLTAISTSAWVYGRWFAPHKGALARRLGLATALVLLASGLYASRPVAAPLPTADFVWEDWSQAKVDQALAEGRPVFVDFTAKWCLTCQVNKKVAYTDDVQAAFKSQNVLLLRADKTSANPVIEEALSALGRSAIPVNVLYTPENKADPTITPEILTPDYLLDLIEEELRTSAAPTAE